MREISDASCKNITSVKMFTCWEKRTPTPPPPSQLLLRLEVLVRVQQQGNALHIQARPKKTPDSGTELASIATLVSQAIHCHMFMLVYKRVKLILMTLLIDLSYNMLNKN